MCINIYIYMCVIVCVCMYYTHMLYFINTYAYIYMCVCTKCGCLCVCVCQFPPNNVQASLKWSCVPVSLVRGHMDLRLRPCGCEGHHGMVEV